MTAITSTETATWTLPQKIAFRFFFIFFILYIFLEPNGVLPLSEPLSAIYLQLMHMLIPWLAAHVLHLAQPITIFTNGSGDTTYDFVILLFIFVVAAIGACVWSATGRNTRNYNKMYYWLCVVVRYYVAITMVVYGGVKIVKDQFPAPTLGRLAEPVGNMSPMGLAWTYMGYSTGFNYFTGMAELTCGLLLFFRRTTTLGAIMGVVVAGNIMAINYCFDVPVKLLATMLVVMSAFLLFRDYHRLLNFFFRNKPAEPSVLTVHRFRKKWKNVALIVFKSVLIAWVLFFNVAMAFVYGSPDNAPKPPFYGVYDVKTFIVNKDTLKPLTSDTLRWRKLYLDRSANVQLMNDSIIPYLLTVDTVKHHLLISRKKFTLRYTQLKPDTLLLEGTWKSDSVKIQLVKHGNSTFPLMDRGFHWVNEFPYNR